MFAKLLILANSLDWSVARPCGDQEEYPEKCTPSQGPSSPGRDSPSSNQWNPEQSWLEEQPEYIELTDKFVDEIDELQSSRMSPEDLYDRLSAPIEKEYEESLDALRRVYPEHSKEFQKIENQEYNKYEKAMREVERAAEQEEREQNKEMEALERDQERRYRKLLRSLKDRYPS